MEDHEMSSESSNATRRQVLKAAVAVVCCQKLTALPASASTTTSVDQITDVNATAATNMFRFEPDLVTLEPGGEISFLNSRADHTVHTIPELWPAHTPKVAIAHKPEAIVRFDREGFYGFRCRRHGQYGMVMLVVVGKPGGAEAFKESVETMRAKPREKTAFLNLLDRYAHA